MDGTRKEAKPLHGHEVDVAIRDSMWWAPKTPWENHAEYLAVRLAADLREAWKRSVPIHATAALGELSRDEVEEL